MPGRGFDSKRSFRPAPGIRLHQCLRFKTFSLPSGAGPSVLFPDVPRRQTRDWMSGPGHVPGTAGRSGYRTGRPAAGRDHSSPEGLGSSRTNKRSVYPGLPGRRKKSALGRPLLLPRQFRVLQSGFGTLPCPVELSNPATAAGGFGTQVEADNVKILAKKSLSTKNRKPETGKFVSGCLLCGSPLTYLNQETAARCVYCQKVEFANALCRQGHYVCDACHSRDALQVIEHLLLTSKETDMLALLQHIRRHPPSHCTAPNTTAWFPASFWPPTATWGVRSQPKCSRLPCAGEKLWWAAPAPFWVPAALRSASALPSVCSWMLILSQPQSVN